MVVRSAYIMAFPSSSPSLLLLNLYRPNQNSVRAGVSCNLRRWDCTEPLGLILDFTVYCVFYQYFNTESKIVQVKSYGWDFFTDLFQFSRCNQVIIKPRAVVMPMAWIISSQRLSVPARTYLIRIAAGLNSASSKSGKPSLRPFSCFMNAPAFRAM